MIEQVALDIYAKLHELTCGNIFTLEINPFTAMLAAPPLGKRPVEVSDLKSLRTFFPFAGARGKISIKIDSIESRIVIGPSNILFAGVSVCTF